MGASELFSASVLLDLITILMVGFYLALLISREIHDRAANGALLNVGSPSEVDQYITLSREITGRAVTGKEFSLSPPVTKLPRAKFSKAA